jgi:heme/copper-type cytochrome/quinol oxidase subunit 2
MSDPNKPDWSDPTQAGYPPTTDPAYAGQYWGPQGTGYYGPPAGAPMTGPTQQLPPYWQTAGYAPNQAPPPPPQPPKSPRWLWFAAAAAVLLVGGLVLALVIVSSSSRQSTVVEPLPTTTAPSVPRATTVPRVPTPTTTRQLPPSIATTPAQTTEPAIPGIPDETTTAPTGTESVVYNVTGEGRAINITYVDTGGVMQTEFNVALPWSKEVSLAAPAKNSASVAVVNVGRDVTCSVAVNGAQVRQRTGRGLTICTGVA